VQLVLPVSFSKHDDFSSFVCGGNQQLVSHLQALVSQTSVIGDSTKRMSVINGQSGVGKSHLLLAVCELASQQSLSHQYLNLDTLCRMPAEVLEGMGNRQVLCVDNLESIITNRKWQVAIFDLINQFIENNGRCLVLASKPTIEDMPFELADLVTRLKWGTNFRLAPLSDELKLEALSKHANALGLNLQDDAIKFLLSRISRDMHKLLAALQQLDKASLQNKRKITIPFIKSVLAI
jgi:DnaA family protein